MAKHNGVVTPSLTDMLAYSHGAELPNLNQTLWDMFHSTISKYPRRDAVVSLWQSHAHLQNLLGRVDQPVLEQKDEAKLDTPFRWSYRDLHRATECLAGWLQSQGCSEGQNLVSTRAALFSV